MHCLFTTSALQQPQVICIPFAWNHEAVTPITYDSMDWMGTLTEGWEWYYADYMLLLTFGGIPWQVYFQRVLSSKSAAGAEILSYIAAFGCIIMAVPPILIGMIAKSTGRGCKMNCSIYLSCHISSPPQTGIIPLTTGQSRSPMKRFA